MKRNTGWRDYWMPTAAALIMFGALLIIALAVSP